MRPAIALLIVSLASTAIAEIPAHILPVLPTMVRVTTGRGMGSGALIGVENGYGYVVTCRHVISGGTEATAEWGNGFKATGQVWVDGQGHDVGIIQVPWPSAPQDSAILPVGDELPPIGARVDCLGFGGGSMQPIHWSSQVAEATSESFTLAPLAVPGDSGGPVLYQGRLVGLMANVADATRGPSCHPVRAMLGRLFGRIRNGGGQSQCPDGNCPNEQSPRGNWLNPTPRQVIPRQYQTPRQQPDTPPQIVPPPASTPPKDDAIQKSLDAIQKTVAEMRSADDQREKARAEALLAISTALQANTGNLDKQIGSLVSVTADFGKRLQASVDVQTQSAAAMQQTITEATSAQTSKLESLALAIPTAIPGAIARASPWWQLPLQALGITGPVGLAAAGIAWLATRRRGQGATPQPFRFVREGFRGNGGNRGSGDSGRFRVFESTDRASSN